MKESKDPSVIEDEEQQDDAIIGVAFRWSLALIVLVVIAVGGVIYWTNRPRDQVFGRHHDEVAQQRPIPCLARMVGVEFSR